MNGIVRTLLDKNRDPMADRGNWINQGKLDRKNKERHGNFVFIGCFIEFESGVILISNYIRICIIFKCIAIF